MDALLQKAVEQGLGYALFVVLLIYVLKKQDERDRRSEEREKINQDIIKEMTLKLGVLDIISKQVTTIERKMEGLKKG